MCNVLIIEHNTKIIAASHELNLGCGCFCKLYVSGKLPSSLLEEGVSMTMPEGTPQKFSSKAADALDDLDSYLARVSHDDSDTDSLDSVDLNLKSTISLRDLTDVCNKCKSVTFSITSAIILNHKKCLECLLGSLINLNNCEVSAEDGTTPVHVAAKQGNREILEMLITKDRSLAETKDARGATATHVLSYNGHHECLPWILKNGGSAAHKDVDGATPVHYGAASGKLECLKELIQTGNGDPNAQTYSGETPGKMWVWLHFTRYGYKINSTFSCFSLLCCSRRSPGLCTMAGPNG